MENAIPEWLGVGIFSVPEAARLTRVPTRRIRRWLCGYEFKSSGALRESPPVINGELPIVDGQLALGFRDLLEVRFVDAFRRHGVSWPVIRRSAEAAAHVIGNDHPFSTRRFKTDGRRIFAELLRQTGDPALLDLADSQYVIRDVISPRLYAGIAFSDSDLPISWHPDPKLKHVVVDPRYSFGRPIVMPAGIPTQVLASAAKSAESMDEVAAWYDIPRRLVREAVQFEKQLAA